MPTSIAAYQFTAIEDPHALAAQLRSWAQAQRLLVAGEGLNPFLAGDSRAVECFVEALRGDVRFAAIRVKYSRSEAAPFARLKVKVKPEIIAVDPVLRPWCDGRNGTGRAAA